MSGGTTEAYDVCDLAKMDMLVAAQEMNTNEVKRLIDNGTVHVDACDDDRVTALQIAAATGNVPLVTYLLEQGAYIDFCNQVGYTAFHQACREGHLKVVEVLLQRGANIHKNINLGPSPLTLAASAGHSEIVKKLINLHVKTSGFEGYSPTPLIAAAFRGNPTTLSYLVKLGKAPINEVADRLMNLSPLTCAVICSNRPMISWLLEMDADPYEIALRGKNAFELASWQKRYEFVDLFKEFASKKKIPRESKDIRQIIIEGDLVKMDQALKERKELPDGIPPTLFATLVSKPAALRHMLVERCMDANDVEPKLGLDSLIVAALFRDTECSELLLTNGASVAAMNAFGQTAYDLYSASLEEPEEHVRQSLSLHSPRKQGVFKLSGNAGPLSKMLSSGKHKFGMMNERGEGAHTVRMRDIYAYRQKIWAVVGRNDKKLILTDDLIRAKQELGKRRERDGMNRMIDTVRSLVEESTSFGLTGFYDLYSKDSEARMAQTFESDTLPRGDIDLAVYRSNAYGYVGTFRTAQQQQQFSLQPSPRPYSSFITRSTNIDQPTTRLRRVETTDGKPTTRTTPRMLKKSRESVSSVDSLGSVRSLALSGSSLGPLDESGTTLRSYRSQPQLGGPVPPRRSSPYGIRTMSRGIDPPKAVTDELKARGYGNLADILRDQEVNETQLNQFDESNFREMGIVDPNEIKVLLDVRKLFR